MQLQANQQPTESDPVLRLVYTIGLLLTAFGWFLPKGHDWVMIGVVIVAFYWLYED
jgi:hypothetical protein